MLVRKHLLVALAVLMAVVVAGLSRPAAADTFTSFSFPDVSTAGADEPRGAVLQVNKVLYGTTLRGGTSALGTIYTLSAAGQRTVHSFGIGTDGAYPYGGLLRVGGLLYGTCVAGGAFNGGVVYSVEIATGVEKVLYSFGATQTDGQQPRAGLILVGGRLMGTTEGDGNQFRGTVFAVDPATGIEQVLHRFDGLGDGQLPYAGLLNVGGLLYGTTLEGGSANRGALFTVDPVTLAETVVYSFTGADGAKPLDALIEANGVLYGTADEGGAHRRGTVFAFAPETGAVTLVHSFASGSDGADPTASLLLVGGVLYGTTEAGGPAELGTVFKLDSITHTEQVVHTFSGNDGREPEAPLIQAGSLLYGTTSMGGLNGTGTAFSLPP